MQNGGADRGGHGAALPDDALSTIAHAFGVIINEALLDWVIAIQTSIPPQAAAGELFGVVGNSICGIAPNQDGFDIDFLRLSVILQYDRCR